MLIKSIIAVLYYNIEEANSYDIEKYEDRQKAERNFSNKKNFNPAILEQAYLQYKERLQKEYENFKLERLK